jgi:tetratricopeptide (TPR) repeat protein
MIKSKVKNGLMRPINYWIVLIILTFFTLIIYSNIHRYPFVFDDTVQIEDKNKIRELKGFLSIDKLFDPRPLVDFTFALNYKVGKLSVFGYHLVNVVIHIANAFIVYLLALNIFQLLLYPAKNSNFAGSYISSVALVSALIFVAHPIQTQAVTYTAQRYTSVGALFYFLSVLFYIRGRRSIQRFEASSESAQGKKGNKRPGEKRRNYGSTVNPTGQAEKQKCKQTERSLKMPKDFSTLRVAYVGWFGFAFIFGALAFLCKQNTASLPGIILLVEYILFDRTWKGWKKKLTWFTPAFFIMSIFILYVSGFFKVGFNFGSLLEDVSAFSRETFEITRWNYLCTQFNVIAIYIRLLFLPFGQNLDHMYPFKVGFFDGLTPLAFLFLCSIVSIGIWYLRKKPVVSLGIFWFFIALSVESSIFPISDAMFEHRLYLPMFGFAIVVAYSIFSLLSEKKSWAVTISVVIVVTLGTATYLRNRVWENNVTLWMDVLSKNPENYRAHNNLGNALKERGGLNEALRHYYEALRIKPDFGDAHNNLGTTLMSQGKLDQAINHLYKAVEFAPGYASAYNNLGVALAANGDLKEAYRFFADALRVNPNFAGAHNSLANTLAQEGKLEKAVTHWYKAIEINPEYAEPHYNLGIVMGRKEAFNEAIEHFSKAIRIKPDYAEAHSKLAVIMAQERDFDSALDHFAEALKINPGLAEARQGIKEILTLKNQ